MRRLYLKLSLYLSGYCTKHYRRRSMCSQCLYEESSEYIWLHDARRKKNSRRISELMELDARR